MQKIILSGCCGHMGRVVADICAGDPEVEVSAGIDLLAQPMEGFPVFSSPAACAAPGDAEGLPQPVSRRQRVKIPSSMFRFIETTPYIISFGLRRAAEALTYPVTSQDKRFLLTGNDFIRRQYRVPPVLPAPPAPPYTGAPASGRRQRPPRR